MKAVFLDKDGTLIEDVPYGVDPNRIRFAAGAHKALCLLHEAGYEVVIVSNQSGVARGYFTLEALRAVETQLRSMLAELNVPLRGFYCCPHFPEGVIDEYARECDCRKPKPGLLMRAARELNIDLNRSWMIGDILHDVQAGRSAGCRTILIDNGNETEWILTRDRIPHHIAGDLEEAARVILASDENSTRRRRIVLRKERKPRRRRKTNRFDSWEGYIAPPSNSILK